jgi:glutamyl/glutaminyl-tRNA synthetase
MQAKQAFQKTRIAPTPSGYLHAGNALSFLLTEQLAQEHGAQILLRIDDMDRQRVRPEYVQDVFNTLRFLGINWQEGPLDVADFEAHWSQCTRMPLYEAALQQLASDGHIYACTCSRTDIARDSTNGRYPGTCRNKGLSLDTPGASWRLRTDNPEPLLVKLRSGATVWEALPEAQHDFVVRKRDGFPAYQLSSLADDVHFGIDLIVRGEDLWDSTLAQLYLARLLGLQVFLQCTFVHHGLITDGAGEKLSKSAGAASIHYQQQQGLPSSEARKTLLARLPSLPLR